MRARQNARETNACQAEFGWKANGSGSISIKLPQIAELQWLSVEHFVCLFSCFTNVYFCLAMKSPPLIFLGQRMVPHCISLTILAKCQGNPIESTNCFQNHSITWMIALHAKSYHRFLWILLLCFQTSSTVSAFLGNSEQIFPLHSLFFLLSKYSI